MIFDLKNMITRNEDDLQRLPNGRWVRKVPEPTLVSKASRMLDAIAVATGKAFAVHWPIPGDLEDALGQAPQGRQTRYPRVGDRVRFSMPIKDGDRVPVNRGVLRRRDGGYRYIEVYLMSEIEPIMIERLENEVFFESSATPDEEAELRDQAFKDFIASRNKNNSDDPTT